MRNLAMNRIVTSFVLIILWSFAGTIHAASGTSATEAADGRTSSSIHINHGDAVNADMLKYCIRLMSTAGIFFRGALAPSPENHYNYYVWLLV